MRFSRTHGLTRLTVAAVLFLPAALTACIDELVDHDITAPTVTISGITAGEIITANRNITVTGHDSESKLTRLEIYVDGSRVNDSDPGDYSGTLGTTLVVDGSRQHTVEGIAVDAAGNQGSLTRPYTTFVP